MTEPLIFGNFPLGDREIAFQAPTDGQVIAAVKITENIKRLGKEEVERAVLMISKVLRIIDHMIVEEEDREYVEDLMIDGKLDYMQLFRILTAIAEGKKEEMAPKTGPKPRARRAAR